MASTTLIAKLVGDAKSMTAAFSQGEAAAKGLGRAGTAAAAGVAALGGAAVAGFAVSINKAMDFESAISSIGAVSGATDKELQGLNDTALRLGRETKFGAMDAAAAMETLAANGISAKDIMGGAADAAAQLAAAGGTDIVSAADTASTAMAVWNLKTKDLTNVVNRLAGAANVSRFGVEDMSMAIAQGGGAAASAGVEFNDFATAIAAIAPSFSSGSDAGTSFKTFVARLPADTAPAKKALRELGIITKEGNNQFFDARGNLKSMADVTDLLNKSTKNLSEEQKARLLGDIFGTDAIRTAAALAQMNGEAFEEMSRKMGDASALELAKKRMDNAKGSMEQLNGAIEVIQITIGQKFAPVVKALAGFLADTLPKIPTEVFVVVGALTVLAGVFASLALVITPIITLAPILGAAFTLMLGPVGLVILAIGALVAAGVLLWQNWDAITKKAGEVSRAIQEVTGVSSNAQSEIGKSLGFGLVNAVPGVGPLLNAGRGVADIGRMIRGYDSGGVVPGPVGSPQLAMVHGGETILPTHRGGMGGVTINQYFTAPVGGISPEFVRAVQEANTQTLQRFGGSSTR